MAESETEASNTGVQRLEREGASEAAWARSVRLCRRLEGLRYAGLPEFERVHVDDEVVEIVTGSVATLRDSAGAVDEPTVRRWVVKLAEILDWLHHLDPPLIHGALSPDDVSIEGEQPRIVGWIHDTAGSDLPADDVRALGEIAVFLLTGRDAAELDSGATTWRDHATVQSDLALTLDAMLSDDAVSRPTAAQVLEGLIDPDDDTYADAITQPTETPAPPRNPRPPATSLGTTLGAPSEEEGLPWPIIGGVVVVLVLVIGGALWAVG